MSSNFSISKVISLIFHFQWSLSTEGFQRTAKSSLHIQRKTLFQRARQAVKPVIFETNTALTY